MIYISSTPPVTPPTKSITYPSPSPPLRSRVSQQSLSSNGGTGTVLGGSLNKRSSFTLSGSGFAYAPPSSSNMAALPQKKETYISNKKRNWSTKLKRLHKGSTSSTQLYSNNSTNSHNIDTNNNHLHPQILTSDTTSSCTCDDIQNSILDINTIPSIWCYDHDDMLRYMLSRWLIPLDLFDTFKSYIHIDGTAVSKPKLGDIGQLYYN